jgi:hypothetical protein
VAAAETGSSSHAMASRIGSLALLYSAEPSWISMNPMGDA